MAPLAVTIFVLFDVLDAAVVRAVDSPLCHHSQRSPVRHAESVVAAADALDDRKPGDDDPG